MEQITTVVNVDQKAYEIYIGRQAFSLQHWGNPFSHRFAGKAQGLIRVASREAAIQAYREWLLGINYPGVDPARRKWILENLGILKGKVLGCFCKPLPCHGDVLIELLAKEYNNTSEKGGMGE